MTIRRKTIAIVAMLTAMLTLTSCAMLENFGEKFNQSWNGVNATMYTYNEDGNRIDQVKGNSFRISRDERFDSTDSEGNSKKDSSVLMISLGSNHISHVGSSMLLVEAGLEDIMDESNARADFENTQPGTPWLNDMIEKHRNLWAGKGKTIMVRSQDGTPIAVYAGDNVEIFATDVPKSTWFRVDGKMLFVYRADYSVFDTELLNR